VDFQRFYWGQWEISEDDKYLFDLAKEYHQRTEEYDQFVCTGRTEKGIAMPTASVEMRLINKNALLILHELTERSRHERNITPDRVKKAISEARTTHYKSGK